MVRMGADLVSLSLLATRIQRLYTGGSQVLSKVKYNTAEVYRQDCNGVES